MRKTQNILVNLILSISIYLNAQNITTDTIKWTLDRYTLLSELGKITIELKQGRDIKGAIITNIDTSRCRIEYFYEGCMHDLLMNKIISVNPQTPHQYSLYFSNNKLPIIKRNSIADKYENSIEFKYHELLKNTVYIKSEIVRNSLKTKTDSSISNKDTSILRTSVTSIETRDLIIFPDGKKLLVKVLEITNDTVSYKRLDLREGPIYKLLLFLPEKHIKAKVINEKERIVIDFNNKYLINQKQIK